MISIITVLWLKKNPLAINALKQVFNEYTQILDTSSIPASTSIPGLLTCFCLEHKTIRGIQKQTNNIKQKNKTHTHTKKNTTCDSDWKHKMNFVLATWHCQPFNIRSVNIKRHTVGKTGFLLNKVHVLYFCFRNNITYMIDRSTIDCDTLANILGTYNREIHDVTH